jgi:hypothetical protein
MAAVNTMKQHGKHLGPFEPTIALGQSQCGFHKCFIHIKYSATSATFHFLHETLRRGKERVSPWWNLWAQFHMRWKLCETPIETQIEFHHATMQLNHTMGEVVGRLSLWNCAMKLCIEGDIYFIPKLHILETGTVKLSIETGLIYWFSSNIS